MIEVLEFVRCPSCATNSEWCAACVHNHTTISRLRTENEALSQVYGLAACMRTFPVPFDDHFQLVGAVDECRSVLEPPIDDYVPTPEPPMTAHAATTARPLVGISVLVRKQGKLLLGTRKGSHGAGEYACPGGHLEHLESFQVCAAREVLEETGLTIGPLRFLRVLNANQYAPKHYVDLAFVADWQGGEPEVREPDKVERWDWYAIDDLPSPLFAMLPSAIAILRGDEDRGPCQDAP